MASTRVQSNLTKKKRKKKKEKQSAPRRADESLFVVRTDVVRGVRVARAPAASPKIAGRTMRILVMRIPDLVEKVDTFRAREERRPDRVYVRVAPTLFIHTRFPNRKKKFKQHEIRD